MHLLLAAARKYALTIFPRIDAAAFIYFVGQFGAATIRGQRLFEGGIYSFRQYDPRRSAHSTQPKFCQQAGKTF